MRSTPAMVAALMMTCTATIGSLPSASKAQSSLFAFAKVVDSDSTLPGSAGRFGGSEEGPALEAGRVAFWSYGDDADGVYTGAPGGSLTLVADTTTVMPHTAVPFEGHDYVSLDRSRVVFTGWGQDDEDNYYEGIYRFENGALNRIADLSTPVPGKPTGLGGFLEFYGPSSSDNGRVAFIGVDFEEVEDGVYLGSGGALARAADTSTRVPGLAENFEFFNAVSADAGHVAFVGDSASVTGLYLHETATGALSKLADTTTQVPGSEVSFSDFGDSFAGLDLDGGSVAFIGSFGTGRVGGGGVYVANAASGLITRIADTTTPIPGPETLFRDAFTAVAVDDGHIALGYGLKANPRAMIPQTPLFGVYTDLGGSLESLLRAGDVLDGKVVRRAYVGSEGLDGNQIAISVVFTDESEGIYIATLIPEPATLALLLLGLAFLVVAVKRVNRSEELTMNRILKLLAAVPTVAPSAACRAVTLLISWRTAPRRGVYRALVAAAFLCGATSTEAQSPRFAFKRVAGENTPAPGGSFLDVLTPSLEAGHVAFLGLQHNVEGVYTISPNNTLTVLADSTTLVPGATVPFDRFGQWLSRDGNRVVFNALAFPESGPDIIEGYYAFENGVVTPIADLTTPIPSGMGNLTSLWNPNEISSAEAGQVAFVGGGENDTWGIYLARGDMLSRVVDTTTPVPNDTRAFRFFQSPVLVGERLAFVADLNDSTQGLYLYDLASATLSVVADSHTPLPGGGGNFQSFGSSLGVGAMLDVDGATVAFLGDREFGEHGALGIYRYDIATGALTTVAEAGTPVPGQPADQFGPYFQSVSVDDGHVAFQYGAFVVTRLDEFVTPHYGIYSDMGGPLEKVLALGDVLDGMMVDTPGGRSSGVLQIGPEALDGNQIALLVQLEDGSRAIYVATLIPEPATVALLLTAGCLLTLILGRRILAAKHRTHRINPTRFL